MPALHFLKMNCDTCREHEWYGIITGYIKEFFVGKVLEIGK